ncbi:MAG: phytanoyl-CoA dioxygenase family protein, partial [Segetibacter sp.]|nr:phytanoyl-CoA dioxygenase family protein [Segetibacter sp.]
CTLIQKGLGEYYFLCKAVYFDKPAQSNWYFTGMPDTWHQDVTIHVEEKKETAGFSGWTQMPGAVSVKPAEEYLKNIYILRIHLDKTTAENGALQVMQNSHYCILNDHEVQALCQEKKSVLCEVEAGGIHLMKPLTLHVSEKINNDQPRRIIHLEFTSMNLPSVMST